jgi:hypothetical protein
MAIFHLMQNEFFECENLQQIMKKLESIPNLLYDITLLIQVSNMPQYKISFSEIKQMRAQYHTIVMDEMEGHKEKYKVNPNKAFKFDMSNFLQKFSMYKGIQQFYLYDINKEKKRA